MQSHRLPIIALIFLAACSIQEDRGTFIQANCPTADSNEHFFPAGRLTFGASNPRVIEGDGFVRHWYSKALIRASEPSLSCSGMTEVAESYRFLWLRTFNNPVVIRIDQSGKETTLHVKVLSGAGGYDPGILSDNREIKLSTKDWQDMKSAIHARQFWQLPTYEQSTGFDGSQWIIEGRKAGKYHVVDRWTPSSGPIHELGLLFIKLAGLDNAKLELY